MIVYEATKQSFLEDVEMINRYIYKSAKKNSENIIGTKYELEVLLKQES